MELVCDYRISQGALTLPGLFNYCINYLLYQDNSQLSQMTRLLNTNMLILHTHIDLLFFLDFKHSHQMVKTPYPVEYRSLQVLGWFESMTYNY